jgi:hypothetical protein
VKVAEKPDMIKNLSIKRVEGSLKLPAKNSEMAQYPLVLVTKKIPAADGLDPCPSECPNHCGRDREIIYCGHKCKDW